MVTSNAGSSFLMKKIFPLLVAAASGSAADRLGAQHPIVWEAAGDHWADNLGAALLVLNDVDGDGFPDLVACARQPLEADGLRSYVRLYSGKTGKVLRTWEGRAPVTTSGTRWRAWGTWTETVSSISPPPRLLERSTTSRLRRTDGS